MGGKDDSTSSLALNTPSAPSKPRDARVSLGCQPSILPIKSHFPSTSEVRSNKGFVPLNHTIVAHRLCSPVSAIISDTGELGNLKDNVMVVGTEDLDTGGVGVVVKGEEVAKLVKMPTKMSPSSMVSRLSSTASYHFNPTPFSTAPTLLPMHDVPSPPSPSKTWWPHLEKQKQRCSSSPPTFNPHTPSPHLGTCLPSLNIQDEHTASPSLDSHTIDDEQCSMSSPLILSPPPLILKDCLDKLFVLPDHSFANNCPTLAHTSDVGQGLLAQGQLGNLKDSMKVVWTGEQVTGDVEVVDEGPGFTMAPSSPSSPSMVLESTSTTRSEISPMAQLMQEYSSVETGIMSVLSLGELTSDLIVDRGKDRTRGLHCYHLAKATLDNICMVVMAQQTFVQQAAALLVEGKAQFIVDPKDTLIPILQGTNSLPQLYVAWKALMARMRLGVRTWGKYVAEYQLQVGAHC